MQTFPRQTNRVLIGFGESSDDDMVSLESGGVSERLVVVAKWIVFLETRC